MEQEKTLESQEQEREFFIIDMEQRLNDLCSKAPISENDKNRVLKAIHEIRNVGFDDGRLMEETITEAYGLMNLIANKAMLHNLKLLNEQTKTQALSPKIKEKMNDLEKTLELIINGIEDRNFVVYQENAQKIVEIGKELEKLAPQISSSIVK
ncbi:MAG: hypothetical protein U0457_15625 [Candidatus Sericytochromatia bacterium]